MGLMYYGSMVFACQVLSCPRRHRLNSSDWGSFSGYLAAATPANDHRSVPRTNPLISSQNQTSQSSCLMIRKHSSAFAIAPLCCFFHSTPDASPSLRFSVLTEARRLPSSVRLLDGLTRSY